MAAASERLTYAVELLDVQPGDRLLELGCGHGVAVSLVCERLDGGRIVALDRSAKMTDATRKRNAVWIERGTASVLTTSLDEADLGRAAFDKVFGVHFPVLLRGEPSRELDVIRGCLAHGGTLHVIFQPFSAGQVDATVTRLRTVLDGQGFPVADVRRRAASPAPVVNVVAGPAG